MRLWSLAHNSFGVVVMIAKLRIHSPAGECKFSHKPASAMMPPPASAQRRRSNALRNAGLVSIPSALPSLGVETRDGQGIGRRHVPARRKIRRRAIGRYREDEFDLADVAGKAGAATHAAILTPPARGAQAGRKSTS
jgi:hypothetical protein